VDEEEAIVLYFLSPEMNHIGRKRAMREETEELRDGVYDDSFMACTVYVKYVKGRRGEVA
jgi:hypothetical protein